MESLTNVFDFLEIDSTKVTSPPRLSKYVVVQAFGAGEGCISNLELLREALVMHLLTGARVAIQDDMVYALPEYLWRILLNHPSIVVVLKENKEYIDTRFVLQSCYKYASEEERSDVFLVAHQGQRLRALLTAQNIGLRVTSISLREFSYDVNSTQSHTRSLWRFRIREIGALIYYGIRGYLDFRTLKIFF